MRVDHRACFGVEGLIEFSKWNLESKFLGLLTASPAIDHWDNGSLNDAQPKRLSHVMAIEFISKAFPNSSLVSCSYSRLFPPRQLRVTFDVESGEPLDMWIIEKHLHSKSERIYSWHIFVDASWRCRSRFSGTFPISKKAKCFCILRRARKNLPCTRLAEARRRFSGSRGKKEQKCGIDKKPLTLKTTLLALSDVGKCFRRCFPQTFVLEVRCVRARAREKNEAGTKSESERSTQLHKHNFPHLTLNFHGEASGSVVLVLSRRNFCSFTFEAEWVRQSPPSRPPQPPTPMRIVYF